MTRSRTLVGVGVTALVAALAPAADGKKMIVVWAPGYPSTTEQAQETMDEFARGVEQGTGWPEGSLGAVYHPTLEDGLASLSENNAVLALVPSPLLYRFGAELDLQPDLEVVPTGGADEKWALVAAKGKVSSPASLEGWKLTGIAAYAPEFVRGPVLGDWGALPGSLKIEFTSRVRSALRRAAAGEPVVVLTDRAQTEALGALPFADQLEIVVRSGPLPASHLCSVGGRLGEDERRELLEAFLRLEQGDEGREVLDALRLTRFRPIDSQRLTRVLRESSPAEGEGR